MNSNYFKSLNSALKTYKRAIPCLLIDLDKLDENVARLQKDIRKKVAFRLVVKSLPSPELIKYLMDRAPTKKIMVFHQPFLSDLSKWVDASVDILLGKPMPVRTAEYYYETLDNRNGFEPSKQLQWLVDTKDRVEEYLALAKKLNQKLRLNLEIDVGLRRGGFEQLDSVRSALNVFKNKEDWISFSGFMGYDPHVVKLPKVIQTKEKAFQKANDFYRACIMLLKTEFPELWNENLCFNGAGSPTIGLHRDEKSVLNDISAGSCLVKPTTFDIPSLQAYQPACFIATPVLKKRKDTVLPGIEQYKSVLNFLGKKYKRSYFIYGGFWKADYCYPPGLSENPLFGSSTNQTMLNCASDVPLEVDDFVFLRPHQSEFVFLQFGHILTIRNGEIQEVWSLLDQRL